MKNIKNKRKLIETIYTDEKSRIYDLYDMILEIMGRNGENSICQSLYSICQCCELFSKANTSKNGGKPTHTFMGLLPFEKQYLQKKNSEIPYEDKFVEHPTKLGLVCKKSKATCIMKPMDCVMYPYSFANFFQKERGLHLDIIVSKHKCPIFSDPKLSAKFIKMTYHRIVEVAEITANFDPRILELWSLFAPFYQGYELLETIHIPLAPYQQKQKFNFPTREISEKSGLTPQYSLVENPG